MTHTRGKLHGLILCQLREIKIWDPFRVAIRSLILIDTHVVTWPFRNGLKTRLERRVCLHATHRRWLMDRKGGKGGLSVYFPLFIRASFVHHFGSVRLSFFPSSWRNLPPLSSASLVSVRRVIARIKVIAHRAEDHRLVRPDVYDITREKLEKFEYIRFPMIIWSLHFYTCQQAVLLFLHR